MTRQTKGTRQTSIVKNKDSTPFALLTKKEIFDTLSEFFGKVIEPRFDRIEKRLDEHGQKFRDLVEHFDRSYTKLDRLETEY